MSPLACTHAPSEGTRFTHTKGASSLASPQPLGAHPARISTGTPRPEPRLGGGSRRRPRHRAHRARCSLGLWQPAPPSSAASDLRRVTQVSAASETLLSRGGVSRHQELRLRVLLPLGPGRVAGPQVSLHVLGESERASQPAVFLEAGQRPSIRPSARPLGFCQRSSFSSPRETGIPRSVTPLSGPEKSRTVAPTKGLGQPAGAPGHPAQIQGVKAVKPTR